MESPWHIELFGSLRAVRSGLIIDRFRSRKIAALLARLALHHEAAHPREELIDLFWPDSEPEAGRQNLSQALSSLRHQFEPPGTAAGSFLLATRADVQLNREAFTTDVALFEQEIRGSRTAPSRAAREQALRSAVALYRGELLSGFYEDWILRERDRLTESYLDAIDRLIGEAEAVSDVDRALRLARMAVRADPLRESSHRHLIRLLWQAGRIPSALNHYRELKRLLRRELDLAPESETEDLIADIRKASATSRHAGAASVDASAPAGANVSRTRGAKPSTPADGKSETRSDEKEAAERLGRSMSIRQEASRSRRSKRGSSLKASSKETADLRSSETFPQIDDQASLSGAATFLYVQTVSPEVEDGMESIRHHVVERGGHELFRSSEDFLFAFSRSGDALEAAMWGMRNSLGKGPAGKSSNEVHDSESSNTVPVGKRSNTVPVETGSDAVPIGNGSDSLNTPESSFVPCVRMALHTGEVDQEGSIRESAAAQHVIRLALAGHAGQILCSETTAVFLRRVSEQDVPIEDLGIYRLRGDEAPGRVFLARVAPLRAHDFPPLDAFRPQGNLPLRPTRFFGRKEDLSRLRARLQDRRDRLTTLLGPGGTGKTRLAIEAASMLHEAFPAGIWFVSLADIVDPAQIAESILQALRLRHQTRQDPLEQAAIAVQGAPSLFILDNFEHLVPEGVHSVSSLLEAGPQIHCLVTSRHRLGLAGEREYPLLPLEIPSGPEEPERLMEHSSVQLFVDRAQMVQPDFQVTPGNAAAVAQLCARLEGIPLALELAAARVQVLAPSQMLRRLGNRLDFLVSRRNDLVARHRTLRAAMDWSYRLLDAQIQRFLAQISIFQGSWTADAAEEVCDEPLALDFLVQLREFSWLVSSEGAEQRRFRMLDTIREYASEQLSPTDRERLEERHLAYYLALAEEAEPHLDTRDRALWLDLLSFEQENLMAALAKCGASSDPEAPLDQDRIEHGLRLGAALSAYWQARGNIADGRDRLTRFLALSESRSTPVYAKALLEAGSMAYQLGDLGAAAASFEASLSIRRAVGDKSGIATAISNLGNVAFVLGDYRTGRSHYETSLEIRRSLGDRRNVARALHNLGNLANAEGDYAAARSHLEESLAIKREFEDPWDIAGTLSSLGNVAANLMQHQLARRYYEESLSARREVGDRQGIAYTLGNLALVVSAEGDLSASLALHQESLAIKRDLGDGRGISSSITNLGGLASRMRDYVRAARLLAAAEASRESTGLTLPPAEQAKYEAVVASVSENLGRQPFTEEWEAGRRMSRVAAIAYALEPPGS